LGFAAPAARTTRGRQREPQNLFLTFPSSRLLVLSLVGCLAACGGATAVVPEAPVAVPAEGTTLSAATTPTSPEVCSNAADDNQNGLIDEGCGLQVGLVQFIAGWSAPKADVDLRVFDPNGELIEVGRVAKSGLTKDRDCPGRSSECQGRNLENVYLAEGEPAKGEYRVRLRLETMGGEPPPIRVTLGARLGSLSRSYEIELDAPEAEREIRLKL
jgi:tRNA (guanosine-2'-O-)-methyltransferase